MMGHPSLAILSPQPTDPGFGDNLSVLPFSEHRMHLTITRSATHPSGRGQRSITMDLDRSEAIALGRYLISQAGGVAEAGGDRGEVRLRTTTHEEDADGQFLGTVDVERTAKGVAVAVTRTYWSLNKQFEIWVTMPREKARNLARALLAISRG